MPRDTSDLLHGTLDLLVLKALSTTPMHGFGLSQWIEQSAGDGLEVVDSALYKALHRLEDAGAVTAEWGVSDNNRRAKFYRLSPAGRARFRAEAPVWHRHAEAIAVALRRTSVRPA